MSEEKKPTYAFMITLWVAIIVTASVASTAIENLVGLR